MTSPEAGGIWDCVIVGGGFTGLAAAADLAKSGKKVLVLEKDDAVGGLAGGFEANGYELEKFYHHWFVSDRYINAIADQIGCSDRIIVRPTRTGLYYAGSFFRLSTPMDLLKFSAIPFFDRIRMGVATLMVRRIKDWRPLEDVTAKDWLTKIFGKKNFDVVWGPLLQGKFGSFADEISAVWFWNKLALRGGSRGKSGDEELAYYKGGFARLARDIADYITRKGGKIETGADVKSIKRNGEQVLVETRNGNLAARSALVTTPMPIAAQILQGAAGAGYGDSLQQIKYLGNVCLVLELDRSLSETYWLNVTDPNFPFVGIIEHTNFEPTESYGGRHIVYLSKYLPTSEAMYRMEADELFEYSLPHIKRMFPAFDQKWVLKSHAWRAEYAQPIVGKRYSTLIPKFETPIDGVFLSTMAQVYPEDRGTNYAVREGQAAAADILKRLDKAS